MQPIIAITLSGTLIPCHPLLSAWHQHRAQYIVGFRICSAHMGKEARVNLVNLYRCKFKKSHSVILSYCLRGYLFPYCIMYIANPFPTSEVLWGSAPIDWCEANFVQNVAGFKIAEINNTITNAAYILAAIALLKNSKLQHFSSNEGRIFLLYCVALLLTGLTSCWFHATLIWIAQKADEIFENCTVMVIFHGTFTNLSSKDLLRRVYVHAVLVSLCIILIPVAFCEVHLIIISFTTVYRFSQGKLELREQTHLGKTAVYAAVGFACWLLDFFACSTFSAYYLHAFGWHCLTGMALYEAGLLLHAKLLIRAETDGKRQQ